MGNGFSDGTQLKASIDPDINDKKPSMSGDRPARCHLAHIWLSALQPVSSDIDGFTAYAVIERLCLLPHRPYGSQRLR
jgi:hypothetical protein